MNPTSTYRHIASRLSHIPPLYKINFQTELKQCQLKINQYCVAHNRHIVSLVFFCIFQKLLNLLQIPYFVESGHLLNFTIFILNIYTTFKLIFVILRQVPIIMLLTLKKPDYIIPLLNLAIQNNVLEEYHLI